MKTKNKIIGFELIKEYPNSKGLGYFEPFTSGEFLKYPHLWKPITVPIVTPYNEISRNNNNSNEEDASFFGTQEDILKNKIYKELHYKYEKVNKENAIAFAELCEIESMKKEKKKSLNELYDEFEKEKTR